jgi:hypothetical protein
MTGNDTLFEKFCLQRHSIGSGTHWGSKGVDLLIIYLTLQPWSGLELVPLCKGWYRELLASLHVTHSNSSAFNAEMDNQQ